MEITVYYSVCGKKGNIFSHKMNTFINQLLSAHYEQRWKYYSLAGGPGDHGSASEEELHLSRKLFWGVFNALPKKVNNLELTQYFLFELLSRTARCLLDPMK